MVAAVLDVRNRALRASRTVFAIEDLSGYRRRALVVSGGTCSRYGGENSLLTRVEGGLLLL
jgi:hypothetical protein